MLSLVDDVYSWSRLTPFDQVKVIILGQVRLEFLYHQIFAE